MSLNVQVRELQAEIGYLKNRLDDLQMSLVNAIERINKGEDNIEALRGLVTQLNREGGSK